LIERSGCSPKVSFFQELEDENSPLLLNFSIFLELNFMVRLILGFPCLIFCLKTINLKGERKLEKK